LDTREPDVRLCPHQISILEFGHQNASMMYLMRLKGHMVMPGDVPGGDGDVHVADHRLFCVEIPMTPDVWKDFTDSVTDANEAIRQTLANPTGKSQIDPEALAAFMNAIPEMFRKDPRKDDK